MIPTHESEAANRAALGVDLGQMRAVEPVAYTVYWQQAPWVEGFDVYDAHDANHAKRQHLGKYPEDKVIRVHKGVVMLEFNHANSD